MNDRFQTLVLQCPVEYGDTLITELRLRRPQGKHLKNVDIEKIDSGNFAAILDLAADLSGQPPTVFDMLEGEDVIVVAQTVIGFLRGIVETSTGP